jgi:hypothetical protein
MVTLSQESIDEYRTRTALEGALSQLDSSWLILVDLRINGPSDPTAADYVALHPHRGIVLIDVILSRTGDPAQRLRQFLENEGFSAQFPGRLPIVRLVLKPTDPASFGRRVQAAFAQVPPISIANPNWVAAVNSLLVPTAPVAGRPILPRLKRPTPHRDHAPERRAPQQTHARPDEPWDVVPDRWPDKVAGATPLNRSVKPAPANRPPPGNLSKPPTARASMPVEPRATEPRAAPRAETRADAVPREDAAAMPRIDNGQRHAERQAGGARPAPPVAPVDPPPLDEADRSPVAEMPGAGPESQSAHPPDSYRKNHHEDRDEDDAEGRTAAQPAIRHAENYQEGRTREAETRIRIDRLSETNRLPNRPPSDQLPSDRPRSDRPRSDRPTDTGRVVETPPGSSLISKVGLVSKAGQEIRSLIHSAAQRKSEPQGRQSPPPSSLASRPAGKSSESGPAAGIARSIGLHRRDEAMIEPQAPGRSFDRAAAEAPRFDSGLTAQRDDFLSARQATEGGRWPRRAAAAVLLVGIAAGAAAWLSRGDMPNKPTTENAGSIASALPEPSAPAVPNSALAPNSPVSPEASASMQPPIQPMPPAAPPVSEKPMVAALPQPAPEVAPVPPAAAPPRPSTKPTPLAAAADAPSEAAMAATSPVVTPPVVAPLVAKPIPEASIPEAKPKPTPDTGIQPASPARRSQVARAVPPRAMENRSGSTPRSSLVSPPPSQGPPMDIADLPPSDSATKVPPPGETPRNGAARGETAAAAPPAAQSSAATFTSAAGSRVHGPTNLLPASDKAPGASSEVCRSYTSTKSLLGQARRVSGLACRDGNGGWQIITELPD